VPSLTPTDRTRLRRKPDRGRFDATTVEAILDEALVCHLGFVVDGRPIVLPTTFARVSDAVYVHGAAGNAALRALAAGAEVCCTVTLLDGLVLARSAFHHSMNYRSVLLFATAVPVTDDDEKTTALFAILDRMVAGRSAACRPPTPAELRATLVLRLPIDEGSAKVRTGGPIDDPEDMDGPYWAGVIPLTTVRGDPVEDSPAP